MKRGDLQMTPEQMLDLAHKAVERVVERIERLPRRKCLGWRFPAGP